MNNFLSHSDSLESRSAEEREWLALQFVLGELSSVQSAEFEAAMLDDAALCEEVVRATRMLAAATLACATDGSRISHRAMPLKGVRQQSVAARINVCLMAVALLGCLILFGKARNFSTVPSDRSMTAAYESATAIAFARLLPERLPMETSVEIEFDAGMDDSLAGLEAPEWLLTAIELEASDSESSETPADDAKVF